MSPRPVIVRVDHDLCVGNGMCRLVAPEVFVANPNGQAVAANPEAGTLEVLLEAVDDCPVGAISVEDAETRQPIEAP